MSEQSSIQSDFLWKVLGRYDHYINTSNTKAGIVGTLSSFIIGGVLLGHGAITNVGLATVFGLLTLVSVLISLIFALLVVFPNLLSSSDPKYRSYLFFEDVAEHESGDAYYTELCGCTDEVLKCDLAQQVFLMAKITQQKFSRMKIAYGSLFVGLMFFSITLVCLLVSAI